MVNIVNPAVGGHCESKREKRWSNSISLPKLPIHPKRVPTVGKPFCWPIACQRGDSTTTRRTWSTIQQRSLDRPSFSPGKEGAVPASGDDAVQRRLEDFEDLDSMYSAYDNWHRGMIISRSASATFPRESSGSATTGANSRSHERGEGGSAWGALADEEMFTKEVVVGEPQQNQANGGGGRAVVGVPFYKTLLSNLSKNNQTYTVNEE